MNAPNDANPELESFREQWRAEVRARKPVASSSHQQTSANNGHVGSSKKSAPPGPPRPATLLSSGKPRVTESDESEDEVEPQAFDVPAPTKPAPQTAKENEEPVTALDHYERAVEKETQGSLGDSLMLYRRAFRVRLTLAAVVSSSY